MGDRDSSNPFGQQILFLDNHLMAINKEAGWSSQPDGSGRMSVQEAGMEWIKNEFSKPGKVFLEPVHRLDQAVSGVLLCARTSKALSRIQEAIRRKEWKKTYWTIVTGHPPEEAFLEDYLLHEERRAISCKPSHPRGKKSQLSFQRLWQEGSLAGLEIELLTGRYHQIRCQLSERNWPILNDLRYGGRRATFPGIALHHRQLRLKHPVKDKELEIQAPLPSFWGSIRW